MKRFVLTVGLVAICAAPALAQDAATLFQEGRALMEQGNFAAACVKFEEANRVNANAVGPLLNLGLCNEKQDKIATALAWYRSAQKRAVADQEQLQIEATNAKVTELSAKVATIEIRYAGGAPVGGTAKLDGKTIEQMDWGRIEVDAGTHELELQAPGREVQREALQVATGDKAVIAGKQMPELKVVEAPNPRQATNWKRNTFIAGGAAVVLFGASAAASYAKCGGFGGQCDDLPAKPGFGDLAVANGLFIGGVVATGAAVYFAAFAPKYRTEKTALVPAMGGNKVGLAIVGSF